LIRGERYHNWAALAKSDVRSFATHCRTSAWRIGNELNNMSGDHKIDADRPRSRELESFAALTQTTKKTETSAEQHSSGEMMRATDEGELQTSELAFLGSGLMG